MLEQVAAAVSEAGVTRHLERLVRPRDPYDGLAEMEAAADYIADAFRRCGLSVLEDRFRFQGGTYRNLVASLPGTSSDGQVLIVAHYDTVPDCPGADDNASGVAGLLEAAKALAGHRFRREMILVAFALEEYGYPGSLHYVERARARGAAIVGVFDLEMIGYTSPTQAVPPGMRAPAIGNFIGVIGNRRSEHLVSLFKDGVARYVPRLPVEALIVEGNGEALPVVRRSDHAPFWDAGYPAVMITDTSFLRNPHYHLPTDTLDTLDLPFLRN
ncbi:MAG: M20/M25/M40 family metallo-hydrolase, partial [Candidatus Methylomirabilaceae bacterium]